MRFVNAAPSSLKEFREILMEIAGTALRLFQRECQQKYFFFGVFYSGYHNPIVPHTNTLYPGSSLFNP